MLVSLALVLIVGIGCASLFTKLKLPGLVGMICAGIILGGSGLNVIDNKLVEISSEIRQIALIIILTRAGLTLNLEDFKKMGKPAIFMSFVPALFEIGACMVLAPMFLGVTVLEGALIGSVLAAVSPAVIVPRMIECINKKLGVEKGIPQLILTGASFDDVVVIAIFSAVSVFLVSGDVNFIGLIQVPVSIISGICIGLSWGYVLQRYFKIFHMRDSIKLMLLLSFSFLFVGMEKQITTILPFSGLIAVMTMAISINVFYPVLSKRLSNKYNKLWVAGEIFLFVLVGVSVNLSVAIKSGISIILLIVGCLLVRMIGVFVSVSKTNYTGKEKLFCAIAYLPKATVQAAIGGIPLAMGLESGEVVLTAAVVSILVSAPIGALLIDAFSEKCLEKKIVNIETKV